MREMDEDAFNKIMKRMVQDLCDAWVDAGNRITDEYRDELTTTFPDESRPVAASAVMNALPNFISACVEAVTAGSGRSVVVMMLVREVLGRTIRSNQEIMTADNTTLESLIATLGGTTHDDPTDDNDRDTAEH